LPGARRLRGALTLILEKAEPVPAAWKVRPQPSIVLEETGGLPRLPDQRFYFRRIPRGENPTSARRGVQLDVENVEKT